MTPSTSERWATDERAKRAPCCGALSAAERRTAHWCSPRRTPSRFRSRLDGAPVSEEPVVWRRDFPIQSAGEEEVTRREFARYLVLGAGAIAATNVGLAVWTQLRSINTGEPRPIVPLATVAVGDTYLFRYPGDNDHAILLRVADREVVAFSQQCTHLGCVVYYESDPGQWHCPCHEGNFD